MAALSTIAAVAGGAILGKVLSGKGQKKGTLATPEAPPPIDTDALTRDAETRMTALATQAQKKQRKGIGRETILTSPQELVGQATTAKATLLGL